MSTAIEAAIVERLHRLMTVAKPKQHRTTTPDSRLSEISYTLSG